ncbi:hypothetical protein ACFOD9_10545 [Novosphingobium bradum]|uniref:DUF3168 domain-containing protein n=1 Tax=Novosphingobium bradum TaxID=1737444 RepID=A0ABV7IRU4_9SPHN
MLHERRAILERKAAIRPHHDRNRPRPHPRGNWMRLLGQVLKLAGGHGDLLRHDERPWASVTFSGARHTLALAFAGADAIAAAERVIAELADHEFDIPGHIVADAQVREVSHQHVPTAQLTMEIEILLLEDL